jgi:hypothetical protein
MIATLSITFTPQTSINHRVCWKETTDSLYDCSTIATSCIAGIPKTVTISVTVFNESCDPIVYEGYVQPVCEPEASLLARTSFPNITFTPDNPCLFWQATCAPGVEEVDVIDQGSGYTPGSTINPTITGDGAGAAATCYVTDGTLAAGFPLTITNPGSGYNDGFYTFVHVTNVSSSGVNARLEVQVTGGVVVSAIRYQNDGGTGYAPGDTISIDNTTGGMGGVGSGAVFTLDASTVLSGTIDYCDVTASGSGYITVGYTISGNAILDVVLTDCDDTYVFGVDCDGNTVLPYSTDPSEKLLPGQIINMCHSQSLPDPVPDVKNTWSVEQREDLCCYDCEQANLTLALGNYGTYNYSYIRCSDLKTVQDSLIYVGGEVPGPIPIEIVCYVKGSLLTHPDINIIGPVACAVI